MPPIKYSDLITPDDSIKRAIEEVQLLRQTYVEALDSIKTAALALKATLKELGGVKNLSSLSDVYKKAGDLAKQKAQLLAKENQAAREQQRLQEKLASDQEKALKSEATQRKLIAQAKAAEAKADAASLNAAKKKAELTKAEAQAAAALAREKDRATRAQISAQNALERQRSQATKQALADAERLRRQQESLNEAKKRETLLWKLTHNSFTQSIALGNVLGSVYMSIWSNLRNGIRNAWEVMTGFEVTMSGMKAILMANDAQFQKLEQDAIRLGGATIFTAKQVGELQIEYGKLGFSTQEILDATEATLALAAAADEGVKEAAATGGAVLRGFNLQANEMKRVANVMTQSFVDSALDLEKFRESMKFIAPVAQQAGFSIEGTTALLMKLADAGLYGSLAGTALRNIILRLSDDNSKLAKAIGGSIKSVEEFIPALKKLESQGISLSDALQLTDRRAVTAFATLLNKSDELNPTIVALERVGNSAQDMANIRMDNLLGSIEKLKGAWEGLIINVSKSENILGGVIRTWVDNLAAFIDRIKDDQQYLQNFIDNIKQIATGILSLAVATKVVVPTLTSLIALLRGAQTGAVGLALAWKGLGAAFKSNAIGLAITGVTLLVQRLAMMEKRSKEAREEYEYLISEAGVRATAQEDAVKSMDRYNEELERERRNARELFSILKDETSSRNDKKIAMEEINTRYKTYLPNLLTEKTTVGDIARAQVAVNDALANGILLKVQAEETEKAIGSYQRANLDVQKRLAAQYGLTAEEYGKLTKLGGIVPVGSVTPGGEEQPSLDPQLETAYQKLKGRYMKIAELPQEVANLIGREKMTLIPWGNKKEISVEVATVFEALETLRRGAEIRVQEINKIFEGQGVKTGFVPDMFEPPGDGGKTKDRTKDFQSSAYELIEAQIDMMEEGLNKQLAILALAHTKEMAALEKNFKDKEGVWFNEEGFMEIKALKEAVLYKKSLELQQEYAMKSLQISKGEIEAYEEAVQKGVDLQIESVEKRRDIQIARINQLEAEDKVLAAAQKRSNEENKKRQEEFETERQRAQIIAEIEILNIKRAAFPEQMELLDAQFKELKAKLDALGIDLKTKDTEENIWTLMGFDYNDADVKRFTETVESQFKKLGSVVQNITNSWVEAADRRVEASQREVDQLQESLQIEMEAKEQGLANDYDLVRQRLRLAEEEQSKAIQVQKKAYEDQRKIETAMQAVSLVSATADIIQSAAAAGGVLAPIVAGVAIAAMWGVFAAAQSKASSVTKGYAKGVIGIDGEGSETSDSIPVRVSRGESIMTAKTTKKYKGALAAMAKNDDAAVMRELMILMSAKRHSDMASDSVRRDPVLRHDLEKVFSKFLDKMAKNVHETGDYRVERIGNVTMRIRK